MARIVLFNKPFRVLSQFRDTESKATLSSYFNDPELRVAGRLDYDSEGLLEALEKLRVGVELKDGKTRPAKAKRIDEPEGLWDRDPPIRYRANIPTSWLELTITEGRNRQVRRMTAHVGHPTLRLIRTRIGDWSLDGLAPGDWRQL